MYLSNFTNPFLTQYAGVGSSTSASIRTRTSNIRMITVAFTTTTLTYRTATRDQEPLPEVNTEFFASDFSFTSLSTPGGVGIGLGSATGVDERELSMDPASAIGSMGAGMGNSIKRSDQTGD